MEGKQKNGQPILAIDTSTSFAAIAVSSGIHSVELRWSAGRDQTTSVLEQIDRCLALAGVAVGDIGAVAIAVGPGMFNGLRVGMSIAKGLAIAGDFPVIGISTLELTAAPWMGLSREVIAVVEAGRGRVVCQRFAAEATLHAMDTPQNMTTAQLTEVVMAQPESLLIGEIPQEIQDVLQRQNVAFRSGDAGGRRPLVLAGLARKRLDRGDVDDLTELEPVYLHGQAAGVAK